MIDQHVLISASAGSGKTYRLVHHFLGIVHDALIAEGSERQPEVIDRTLAATFTRAAAGEIIDRILKRIALAASDERDRKNLCEALGLARLSQEDCWKMLQALLTRLNRLRVCTLDSFLVRSAQAYSTELGLPDQWSILNDSDDYAASLEAVDEMLDAKAANPEEFDRMVDLIVMLHRNRYPVQIREKVVEQLRSTQGALTAGPYEAWEAIAPIEADLMAADALADCLMGLSAKLMPMIPLTKAGKPNSNWFNATAKLVLEAKGEQWDSLVCSGLIGAMAKTPPNYHRAEFGVDMLDCLQPLRGHATALILARLLDRNRSTREMLSEYVELYAKVKARRAAYRFDDFTVMLLDAEVSEDLADFYYRLDGQIDHILLDEFQDTSIPQWKLIKPLVEEIMSGEGAKGMERSFFCVGDVKQTLYGWRNAEPRLLGELCNDWPQISRQDLVHNRRSAPVIIKTVNEIFATVENNASLLPEDDDHAYLGEATAIWSTWFQSHETVPEKEKEPGYARLVSCAGAETSADRQHEARRLAAKRAAELLEARPDAEIAILVRRKSFIAPILAMLRNKGLRASGEGGSLLSDDMAVCVVLSLLHLIDHPSDTAAVFHVGNSPLGKALGFSEEMEIVEVLRKVTAIRADIYDAGLGATVNRWIGRCSAGCDERNLRRLGQLVELAHGYEYDGGGLGAFIDAVKAARVEDQEASKIRVMTVHASKGREFDYVILPDLDGDFIGGGSAGPAVLLERDHLLGAAAVITTTPSAAACAVQPRLERMSQTWKARQVVEELCVLYVALTRAKTGLEMIVHPQGSKKDGGVTMPKSAAGVLRAALYGNATVASKCELWIHDQSVMPAGTSTSTSVEAVMTPIKVNVRPPIASSRLRPVVSPSAIEGAGTIQLDGLLTLGESRGREWGTVMHRWFETIEWIDEFVPTDAQLRQAAEQLEVKVSPEQLVGMITRFRLACAGENLGKLLRKSNYLMHMPAGADVEIWRERPFAVPMEAAGLPDSVTVRGQIDRVVVVRVGGKAILAEVIDYKTDSVDKNGLGVKQSYYKSQLAAYRYAVGQLLGIPETAVSAKLAFIGIDAVVETK